MKKYEFKIKRKNNPYYWIEEYEIEDNQSPRKVIEEFLKEFNDVEVAMWGEGYARECVEIRPVKEK